MSDHVTVFVPVVYKRIPCLAKVKAVVMKAVFGAPAEVLILGGTLENNGAPISNVDKLIDLYSATAFQAVCTKNKKEIESAIFLATC